MNTTDRLTRYCFLVGILFFFYLPVYAQVVVTVPNKIRFANMQLYIQAEAKEEIQKKVTSLTKSPSSYKEVFHKVNLYMPFIEKVLKEEGVPDDLKYLVIQESVLVPDVVSTSDAVGFWQFKKEAGLDASLRMDHAVDERMHIIASTRGFCNFIKSHHSYFNNWLHALFAHYWGRTGTANFIAETQWHIQANKAVIDKKTPLFIYHFIAHKIVFEKAIGKELHPNLRLYEYHDCHGKTLHEMSQEFNVSVPTIQAYNKWLKPIKVPEDVRYSILIPMTHQQYAKMHGHLPMPFLSHGSDYEPYWDKAQNFPALSCLKGTASDSGIMLINRLKGILATGTETLEELAQKGNISLKSLLAYNEIDQAHVPLKDQIYYFENKNSKARVHYHIVRKGENWWTIAQKYGMKQKSILLKNRLREVEILLPGRVLWLRFIRPTGIPIAYLEKSDQELKITSTPLMDLQASPPEIPIDLLKKETPLLSESKEVPTLLD